MLDFILMILNNGTVVAFRKYVVVKIVYIFSLPVIMIAGMIELSYMVALFVAFIIMVVIIGSVEYVKQIPYKQKAKKWHEFMVRMKLSLHDALLEPMKVIVKSLLDKGKSVEEIGKELGMKPEEVFRLSDFTRDDFLKMMAREDSYSMAEIITKY